MNDVDLKALWQSTEPSPTFQIDLETVKTQAARFDTQIRRRNAMEWLASIFVVFFFGYDAFIATDTLEMLGNLCTAVAAIGIAVYLYLRGQVMGPPDPGMSHQEFRQQQADSLRAQAHLCQTVPIWYLAPLGLGLALLMIARYPSNGPNIGWGLTAGVVLLVFVGVWIFNLRTANRLKQEASEILAVIGTQET